MKFPAIAIALGCLISSSAASGNDKSVTELLSLGLLQQKANCAKSFPALKEKLDLAFAAFAESNSKHVSIDKWHETESRLTGNKERVSKDWCSTLFLRNRNFDDMISILLEEESNQRRIEEMMAEKKDARSVIGVGFSDKRDAYVAHVVPKSPAEIAGLREGDFILMLDNGAVTSAKQFVLALAAIEPGRVVKISVRRGLELFAVSVPVTTAGKLERE